MNEELSYLDPSRPSAAEAAQDAALDRLYRHVEDDCEWCVAIRALRPVVNAERVEPF